MLAVGPQSLKTQIVGETPTSGIDRSSLRYASARYRTLRRQGYEGQAFNIQRLTFISGARCGAAAYFESFDGGRKMRAN